MRLKIVCTWLLLSSTAVSLAHGQRTSLDRQRHHLRSGTQREWADFPQQAESNRLQISFQGHVNSSEQTLGLKCRDAKQGWRVTLNDSTIGRFPSDENALNLVFKVPAATLVQGQNRLVIEPTSDAVDDIFVEDVWLDPRPLEQVTGSATLSLKVFDERSQGLPSRLTIVDSSGAMAAIGTSSNERLAIRHGMVYTADGDAVITVSPGVYTVYATRGPEYSMDRLELSVAEGGKSSGILHLRREVDTTGYVSCDTHVHTLTYSGHGDATIQERMITLAGEGVELPIATDHNLHIDYDPTARQLGMRRYFTPVIGNEVTTSVGHFNVFPVQPGAAVPDHRSRDWPAIFDGIFGTPGVKIAILNHGRDLHGGYRPFDPQHHLSLVGENLDGWQWRANAMEVVNSAAMQTDCMPLFHDWFGLLNRGLRVTPVGSSDSHEVARKLVGQARTYIACPDDNPEEIDVDRACQSFLEGKVLVSMGLLTQIRVDDRCGPGELASVGPRVTVNVHVQGPSWVAADRVVLYANGLPIRQAAIARPAAGKAIQWRGEWVVDRPAHDVHLVAIATGPGVDAPYWRCPKPYQPTSPVWQSYVVGATGAVWLDVDSDGKPTSARTYAETLLQQSQDQQGQVELPALIRQLQPYDEIVAAHVAHLLSQQGKSFTDDDLQAALRQAAGNTATGFRRYYQSWRESQTARQ